MDPTLSSALAQLGKVGAILISSWILIAIVKRSLRSSITRLVRIKDARSGKGEHDSRSFQRSRALIALAGSFSTVLIWIVAFLLILGVIGINLAPLIAGASVFGVALGFGAQSLVKDLLAGVSTLIEDQYGLGDVVDLGEAIGVVESMSLKSTRVRGVDGTLWHVPNGGILRVANKSQEWSRLILDVGVAYSSDLNFVYSELHSLLAEFAKRDDVAESILEKPEVWGVERLANSSIDVRIAIKVKAGTQWGIARELRKSIKDKFDEVNIEIPFPQVTVWQRE